MNLKDILDEVMSNPLGGEIQSDASEATYKRNGLNGETMELHLWNGKRYKLDLVPLDDGPPYDTATGLPILSEK